jgi:hypothetical protein
MDGKQVVEKIIQDVESFFDDKENYKVNYLFAPRESACKSHGDNTYVIINDNIAHYDVIDLAGLMLVMIEVCHELAHYLNRHSIYISDDEQLKPLEDRSLEDWADFFGAKLIFTLIMGGRQIRSLAKELGYSGLRSLLSALNDALKIFYASRYLESDGSPIYASKDSRVGLCVAGINSVLDRISGVKLERSQMVFEALHLGTDILKGNQEIESRYMSDTQSVSRAGAIMRKLQGTEASMFKGMDPLYIHLLGGDTYHVTEDAREKYIAERARQYKEQGLFD